jgi:hypothetical protein
MRTDRLRIPEHQRVDRDPCPRCNANPERINCGHNRQRLCTGTMGVCCE